MPTSEPFCPYVGLQPYTEEDQEYFFGREIDIQTIAANLVTTPLTLLYGMSGVGKSSVLLAGVVPYLRNLPDVTVVKFRSWQSNNLLESIRTTIAESVSIRLSEPFTSLHEEPIDELLARATNVTHSTITVIFDQFEEFFLYHPETNDQNGFDAQFARVVNRENIDANFLLSIREDSTSHLDRFQHRIPNIWNNSLRLEHLNLEAAEQAIRKPLEKYNITSPKPDGSITVEDNLVKELLLKARLGQVTIGSFGEGQLSHDKPKKDTEVDENAKIETPFLQLVLTRLWKEDINTGGTALTLQTLNDLGGVERIVKSHLDNSMNQLSGAQRKVASRILTYLVTPEGGKIALTASAIADWSKLDKKKVEPVLATLSKDQRILRSVEDERYELFHDQYAPAILDWRRRFVDKQKMFKTVSSIIGVIFFFACVSVAWAWFEAKEAEQRAQQAALESALILEQDKNKKAKRELEKRRELDDAKRLYNKSAPYVKQIHDFEAGLRLLDKALRIFSEYQNQPMILSTLIRKGEILALNKKYATAQALYDQALQISTEINDQVGTGKILEQTATIKERQGKQSEALRLLVKAQVAFQEGADQQSRGRVSERLAVHDDINQRFKQARKLYEQALTSYSLSGDNLGVTRIQEALKSLPWGFLRDLQDGKVYPLRGDQTELGRSVPQAQVQADISFPNRFISRHHLVIRRDHSVEDLRSRNGTTINGIFLPYGLGRKLQEGDIISLAHIKTLRFRLNQPTSPLHIPSNPWAIFIDSQSRTSIYLNQPEYSLILQKKSLSTKPGLTQDAVMRVRWNDKAELFDMKDEWDIIYTQKETDYEYRSHLFNREGRWMDMWNIPFQLVKLSPDNKSIEQDGPSFQFILFE